MISSREAAAGLYGAWRLAHLDAAGHRWFDVTIGGAIRSFWAAAIAAPPFLLVALLRSEGEVDFDRALLVEPIAYAIGWVAFPLIAERLVRLVDREARFLALVSAYNWANALSIAAQTAVALVVLSGVLPGPLRNLLWLAMLLAVVGYHGFVVKTALEVGWGAAIGFVLADLAVTVLVSSVAHALERG